MELCVLNLEKYMKMRNEGLSIEELKDLLLQLNKIFKLMNDNYVIYNDLKLSKILMSINKINKVSFKLCGLYKNINENFEIYSFEKSMIMFPKKKEKEILKLKIIFPNLEL